jgi:tripartite-type tricarboxylate transporter receptor subunit TctC
MIQAMHTDKGRTMNSMRRGCLGVLLTGLFASMPALADFPGKPVRILVSAAPGSSPDLTARVVAQQLAAKWGQPVVVEDVPGAGGNLAAEKVAKSPADGHTLLFASAAVLYFNKALYPKLSYDIDKDLVMLSRVSRTPNMLVVPVGAPWKSIQELVQAAKTKPGEIRFGSGGSGSSMHVIAEVFAQKANVKFEHIPYKSSTQMVQELLAGQIDFTFQNIAVVMPFVKAGKLRALGVTSEKRFFLDPAIPTVKESGWPIVWEGGSGLLAPAGTPAAVVNKIAQDVEQALNKPEVKAALQQNGVEAAPLKTTEFAASVRDTSALWASVIRTSGAKVD